MSNENNPYYLRNKIVQFFAECNIPVEVIGKLSSPSVIYDYKKVLNCYLQGCRLHFTHKGEVLFKQNILHVNHKLCPSFKDWFLTSDHRECYRIKVQDKELYLNGYIQNNGAKVAKFAATGGKVYFSEKFAQGVLKKNDKIELKLEVT